MKVLYKQKKQYEGSKLLDSVGVSDCYLKYICTEADEKNITKKAHSHTGFEIHIINSGYQKYEIDGKTCEVGKNEFLVIAPGVSHRVMKTAEKTEKYSLTFSVSDFKNKLFIGSYICKSAPKSMTECCLAAHNEFSVKREFSKTLIENRTWEIIVLAFRAMGFSEGEARKDDSDENVRVELAKKYIKDNIESPLRVEDAARYCYIGEKQLTRLFLKYEAKTPGEYIREQKIKHIEVLLSSSELSLKDITDIMNFNNEYYFNAFFKKYYGMPPGEYRKMQNGKK